jgi:hypothetical protein
MSHGDTELPVVAARTSGPSATRDPFFDAHPAAVFRPDRYVFGVVDEEWNLDRLLVEFGRRLCLR